MLNNKIPSIDRPEWRNLVCGIYEITFENVVLKSATTRTSYDISQGRLSVEKAVRQIHSLCCKYPKTVQKDFFVIFEHW